MDVEKFVKDRWHDTRMESSVIKLVANALAQDRKERSDLSARLERLEEKGQVTISSYVDDSTSKKVMSVLFKGEWYRGENLSAAVDAALEETE